MQHILLTGGAGFIGSHLVRHLLKNTDWKITVLDSLSYAGDVGRIPELHHYHDRLKIYWHDLRVAIPDTLQKRVGKPDYIVNLASHSHVDRSIENPADFVSNNVALALNMLDYARQVKPDKFIQFSTDEVFGPAAPGKFHKEWDRQIPSNPYAASKSAQEAIAISYWRTYGVPVIISRTMNNFGQYQHSEKLIPKAIKCLLNEQCITVHAEYTNEGWHPGQRTWLHAQNTSDAILFLLERHHKPPRYPYATRPACYHIAGEVELNNLEVVYKVAQCMKQTPIFEFKDCHSERPGHDRRYALDGSKLAQLGWTPPLDLDESFQQTVDWYKAHPEWL